MKLKVYRVYIPEDLFKKYQHLCIDLDLSMPKQTTILIRHFVEIQEENQKRLQGEK